jgi:hypothetical protein
LTRISKLQALIEAGNKPEAAALIIDQKLTGPEVFFAMLAVVEAQRKIIQAGIENHTFGTEPALPEDFSA